MIVISHGSTDVLRRTFFKHASHSGVHDLRSKQSDDDAQQKNLPDPHKQP
jgi:hypothetical protein